MQLGTGQVYVPRVVRSVWGAGRVLVHNHQRFVNHALRVGVRPGLILDDRFLVLRQLVLPVRVVR